MICRVHLMKNKIDDFEIIMSQLQLIALFLVKNGTFYVINLLYQVPIIRKLYQIETFLK